VSNFIEFSSCLRGLTKVLFSPVLVFQVEVVSQHCVSLDCVKKKGIIMFVKLPNWRSNFSSQVTRYI